MGLQEIVVTVDDLNAALKIYRDGLGLRILGEGPLGPMAGSKRSETGTARAVILGRPDVEDSPRLRLVVGDSDPVRNATTVAGSPSPPEVERATRRPVGEIRSPGPLGIGFTTRGIEVVHPKVAASGVRFVSDPVRLTPDSEGPTGPQRFEAFGQTPSGEFVVLIDRRDAPTPYGALSTERPVSEPLHTSWVVADQAHCARFMSRVLGHQLLFREECAGEEFERLMGVASGTRFCFTMLGHPNRATGRIIFIEFDGDEDLPRSSFRRGITGLSYDCGDLDAALARAAALGVSPPSAPVRVDDPRLGGCRVAIVRPPWGSRLELWERS